MTYPGLSYAARVLSLTLLTASLPACSSDSADSSEVPPTTHEAGADAPSRDAPVDQLADQETDNGATCPIDINVMGPLRVGLTQDVVFNLPDEDLDVFVRRAGSNNPFEKLSRSPDGTATFPHDKLTFAGLDYYFTLSRGDCESTKPPHDPESSPLHVRVYGTKNLTSDPSHVNSHPHVYEHSVVYVTDMGGTAEQDVELFDLDTFTKTKISTQPAAQREPRVSSRWITWIDERNHDSSKLDIFGFDRQDNTEHALITEPHTQYGLELSGGVMIWQDYRNETGSTMNGDIYLYDMGPDGTFGTADDPGEQVLTKNTADQGRPDVVVHPDGQIVAVWEDMRDDSDGDCDFDNCDSNIYVTASGPDGVFGTSDDVAPRAVSDNPARQNDPVISDRWIVWRDWRDAKSQDDHWALYAYDLGPDGLFGTSDDGGELKIPVGGFAEPGSLDIDGSRLVYTDLRAMSQEVYLFDLTTKLEQPITAVKGIQRNCAVSGRAVVWQDGRNNQGGKASDDIWVRVLP